MRGESVTKIIDRMRMANVLFFSFPVGLPETIYERFRRQCLAASFRKKTYLRQSKWNTSLTLQARTRLSRTRWQQNAFSAHEL